MPATELRSMTGFGQGIAVGPELRVSVQLRSVNNRFAELRMRLPPELGEVERELRKVVLRTVRRGRVDLALTAEHATAVEAAPALNDAALTRALAAEERLRAEFGVTGRLDVGTLLAIPGVLRSPSAEIEWDEDGIALVRGAVDRALAALDADRVREGRATASALLDQVAAIERLVPEIRARAASVPATLRDRLLERLAALGGEPALDPSRVAHEAALLAERADVTEEIVRLEGHLQQLRSLLAAPDAEPVGKRLEFLVQELQREANTLGSKSPELELTRRVLEVKSALEKIREQIQNLE